MKIKCIANSGSALPSDCRNELVNITEETQFHLTIGKTYNVYGMTIFLGYIWYYICDDAYKYYPAWSPSPLFEVVDGRISKYWYYSCKSGLNRDDTRVIFSYKEWVEDHGYYEELIDGAKKEVGIFARYKKLMDREFPDLSISKNAKNLGNNWVMCPDCTESWEETSGLGMLECPKCGTILHNPFHDKKHNE